MKLQAIEEAEPIIDAAVLTAAHGGTEMATAKLLELCDAVKSMAWQDGSDNTAVMAVRMAYDSGHCSLAWTLKQQLCPHVEMNGIKAPSLRDVGDAYRYHEILMKNTDQTHAPTPGSESVAPKEYPMTRLAGGTDPLCGYCGRPIIGGMVWGAAGPYHPECVKRQSTLDRLAVDHFHKEQLLIQAAVLLRRWVAIPLDDGAAVEQMWKRTERFLGSCGVDTEPPQQKPWRCFPDCQCLDCQQHRIQHHDVDHLYKEPAP